MALTVTQRDNLFQALQRVRIIHEQIDGIKSTIASAFADLKEDFADYGYTSLQDTADAAEQRVFSRLASAASPCKTLIEAIIRHDSVTDNLILPNNAAGSSASYDTVVNALADQNSIEVNASSPSISAGSYSVNASGSADILDIVSSFEIGTNGGQAFLGDGITSGDVTSQLPIDGETFYFYCISDSLSGNRSVGNEQFTLVGNEKAGFFSAQEGSGSGPTLTPADNRNMLTNGSFDTWASGNPTGWTIDTGVAATDFEEEATTVLHGSSIEFKPGGTAQLTQTISASNFTLGQPYCLHWWYNRPSGISVNPIVISARQGGVELAGDYGTSPYTTTGFEARNIVFVPTRNDQDIEIRILYAPSGSDTLYIDRMVLAPLTYFGGVAWGIFLGDEDDTIQLNDARSYDITHTEANVQEFFRVHMNHYWPHDNAGGENIDDNYTLPTYP